MADKRFSETGHALRESCAARALRFAERFVWDREIEDDLASPGTRRGDEAERLHDGVARQVHRDSEPRDEDWSVAAQARAAQAFGKRVPFEIHRDERERARRFDFLVLQPGALPALRCGVIDLEHPQ